MNNDRLKLIQEFGDFCSDWSEDCYCAGWLIGWEDIFPSMVHESLAKVL